MDTYIIIDTLRRILLEKYPEYYSVKGYVLLTPWFQEMIYRRKDRFTTESIYMLASLMDERMKKRHAICNRHDYEDDIEDALNTGE